jgi:hypothetical protein
MEYGYGFDQESPRFALNTLWFPLGVIVFAFSVLIMTAIVTGGPDRGYYLNVQQERVQTAKPAVTRNHVPVTTSSTSSGSSMSTSPATRHNR